MELCPIDDRRKRENWYLSTFQPLLNMLTDAYSNQLAKVGLTGITRARISAALIGRTHSQETKERMSVMRTGEGNPNYGKSLHKKTLDAAVLVTGKQIYAYDAETFTLVNGTPFRSIRDTAKQLPIAPSTLPVKLNTNQAFKGYFYFTTPQESRG